jgi:hypothetical protein
MVDVEASRKKILLDTHKPRIRTEFDGFIQSFIRYA